MTVTLAASQPIAGQAGSNSAINYSICFDDVLAGVDAFQTVSGTLTTSIVALYTPAASHIGIIKTVHLKNVTAAPVTVNMFIGGITSAFQSYQGLIPANGSATYDGDWTVYDSSGFPQTAGATGPTGARGLTWQGAWSSLTTYAVDDAVYYATTGQSYRSLVAGNLNHTPPATFDSFWYQLVQKGDTGLTGSTGPPGVVQDVLATDSSIVVAGTTPHPTIQRAALTGDITASAGSNATVLANTGPGVTGPFGTAGRTAVVTIDAKGRITGFTDIAITPAGIGAPSGSGSSSGSNTGDQTITLTSDVTGSGVGSFATTLKNTGPGATGPLGSASVAPVVTIDAQGRVTALTSATITPAAIGATPTSRLINTTAPITGGGDLTADRTIAITAASATAAGSLGTANFKKLAAHLDAEADFGFVGDLRSFFDGACNSGAPTKITSATIAFTSNDLGKRITLNEAAASSAMYAGTITNIDSATQVTVSPSITTTVSGKGVQVGTDNTAAITAMMTYVNTTIAAFPGATIEFGQSPTNAWGFPIPVVFNKSVNIIGLGGGFNVDAGDYTRQGGTRLAWWGTTADGGVDFGAWWTFQPAGGATQPLTQPAFRRVWFDGRNCDQSSALFAVKFEGCASPIMDDTFIIDSKNGVLCQSTTVTLNPQSAQGVLRPVFRNCHARLLESFTGAILTPITTSSAITLTNSPQAITVSAATMPTTDSYAWVETQVGNPVLIKYTGGGTTTLSVKCSVADAGYGYATIAGGNVVSAAPNNGSVYSFSGDANSNTNCGLILQGQLTHGTNWGPAAVDFRNSDSMDMQDVYLNGGNNTNDGAINRMRKPGVRVAGHNTLAGFACRNITLRSGDPGSATGGGVSSMGVLNTGAKLGFPAGPTYYDLMQLANGAPIPTVEPFSAFMWTPNGGLVTGMAAGSALAAGQGIAAATLTQINGTLIAVPPQGFQVGTVLRWTMQMTKTAVGTAGSLFQVRIGAAGTTADGIVAAATSVAGTAAVGDWTVVIEMTVRGPLGGTAAAIANIKYFNTGVTGWLTLPFSYSNMAMSTFNTVTSGLLYAHVAITSGATVVPTVTQAFCEVINPSNP